MGLLMTKGNCQIKGYQLVRGHNVPGGHNVLWDGKRKPFVPPMRECMSIKLRTSDVVADIGAYCGTYALIAARTPVKAVYAYEPTPISFRVLNTNNNINLHNIQKAVVGDDSEFIDLYISQGIGVTNSLIPSKRKPRTIQVEAINYKIAVAGCSVVKIDVEGAEYDYPIVQDGIRALIIDFHKIGKNWIEKAENKISEIESAGFKPVIKPDWSNGWTQAGSWVRNIDTSGRCDDLFNGLNCLGCGTFIEEEKLALCRLCTELWEPKYKLISGIN